MFFFEGKQNQDIRLSFNLIRQLWVVRIQCRRVGLVAALRSFFGKVAVQFH